MGGPFGAGVQLLIATGARREEMFGASRGELDVAARCLRLPAARSKSGEGRIIALSPLAMGVVEKLPQFAAGDWLLTVDGHRPYRAFSAGKARLDADGGRDRRRSGWPSGAFTICAEPSPPACSAWACAWRSSRPCSATFQAAAPASSACTSGTRSTAEAAAAVDLWGDHLAGLLDPRPAKVLPMRRAR